MKLSSILLSALGLTDAAPAVEKKDVSTRSGHGDWIVCYYTNWSQYRPGLGQFFPEDIDPGLCTHMVFSFAKMCNSSSGWTLCPYEWNDQDEPWADGLYTRMKNLKNRNPNLKSLLAVGGWNHGSAGFVEMVSSRQNMEQFAVNAIKYINDIGYDGFDLDWEYPAKTAVDTSPQADYYNFQTLCDVLRGYIDTNSPSTLLTAAVGIGQDKIYEIDGQLPSYNMANMNKNLDMINLMAYDIHGHWEDKTGHHALLHVKEEDDRLNYTDSIEWIIDNWIALGADPKKMALGLPAYGRTFKLAGSETGYMAPCELGSNGLYSGQAGPYTREGGYLAYYEVCERLKSGWTSVWDDEGKVPYAFGDGDWVGYDNPDSIELKVQLAKSKGLGGIMWWAVDVDDFDGSFCNQGKYPLMTRAKNVWLDGNYTPTTQRPSTGTTQTTASTARPTSSSATTTKATTLPSGGCTSGEYYPDPSDCSKYSTCANGNLTPSQCAAGLSWDDSINACNWAAAVDCCNGQRPCNN